MAARPPTSSDDAALSLAMAVVAASPGPLLLLDGDLAIVAASDSFSDAFGLDPPDVAGQSLSTLGRGEWALPQLRTLLEATASGATEVEAYEIDLKRPGQETRRLVIHAQRLVYVDLEDLRLLVAVSDVTDLRADQKAKEDALRQNAILLQEVRHRVANSLQIIASVLLQNARKASSDETRTHLKDAHSRVMSVAALERLLAGTGEASVELATYFTKLCDSIAASMIADADHISLKVAGAPGVVEARVSVSLGLIVTELVINALKHAFPDHRAGRITVACDIQGPNWTLSVTDDGVGMPTDPAQIHTGLGTSIVQALAQQLSASLERADARPGTRVVVSHTQIALAEEDPISVAARSVVQRPSTRAC